MSRAMMNRWRDAGLFSMEAGPRQKKRNQPQFHQQCLRRPRLELRQQNRELMPEANRLYRLMRRSTRA